MGRKRSIFGRIFRVGKRAAFAGPVAVGAAFSPRVAAAAGRVGAAVPGLIGGLLPRLAIAGGGYLAGRALGRTFFDGRGGGGGGLFGQKKRRRSRVGISMNEMGKILFLSQVLGKKNPAVMWATMKAIGGKI